MFRNVFSAAIRSLPFARPPIARPRASGIASGMAIALLAAMASPASLAAPLVSSDPPNGAFSLAPAFGGDSAELRQIVELLKRGEEKSAKAKLSEFLGKYPNDTRAIELTGTIFLQEKNYRLAAVAFRRVLASNPANHRVLSKLGVALLQEGNNKQAEAALNKAVTLHSGEPFARRYLGVLEEGRGNLDGAVRHYRAAIAGGDLPAGTLTDVHLALGRVYNALGRYADTAGLLAPFAAEAERGTMIDVARFQLAYAYIDLQQVKDAEAVIRNLEAALKPGDADLLFLKAYLLSRTSPAKGRDRLKTLIKAHPAYALRAQMWIARSYVLEGKPAAAAKALEELAARAEARDLPEVLIALSAVQTSAGKPQEAAQTLDAYARKYPDLGAIRYKLAELRLQSGDAAAAEALVNTLLAQNPDFAQGYALLGRIARVRGDPATAETHLQKAVWLDGSLVSAWVDLAGARVAASDLPGAERVLVNALNRNPGVPTLQYELASIEDEMGKWREANSYYRAILASYPSHVPSLNNLALNLAEQENDLAGARKLAEKAYQIDRRSPGVQDTYGWILVLDNDAARGLPLLEQAARGLRDATVSYHLGVAMIKTGKAGEGKRLLQNALASGLPEDLRHKAQALVR